jgi:HPt (histidine-containing phosphotransfer) domain-containing protein
MPETLDPGALAEVMEMAGGDREFVMAVIEEYLTDSAANVAALRGAEGADLVRVAHTLKSTSASVGAHALSAICAEIERTAKDGPVDPALIASAEAEHASAREALERHLETL